MNEKRHIILLDDVIRFCLNDIFSIFDYDAIEAYTIKLTRDAELDIDSDVSKSYVEKISKECQAKKERRPRRVTLRRKHSCWSAGVHSQKIKLFNEEHLIPGGRYHNFKDFISFPNVGRKELRYAKSNPLTIRIWRVSAVCSRRLKTLMYCLHIRIIHFITSLIYWGKRPLIPRLHLSDLRFIVRQTTAVCEHADQCDKNRKQVTAVVELQARFDEETKYFYANKLQEEGAEVILAFPD